MKSSRRKLKNWRLNLPQSPQVKYLGVGHLVTVHIGRSARSWASIAVGGEYGVPDGQSLVVDGVAVGEEGAESALA